MKRDYTDFISFVGIRLSKKKKVGLFNLGGELVKSISLWGLSMRVKIWERGGSLSVGMRSPGGLS